MKKSEKVLTKNEQEKVEAAIAEAEKITSGEIVVALATTSGRYDRAEDIVGLLGALLASGAVWLAHDTTLLQMTWASANAQLSFWCIGGAIVIGFFLGAWLATLFPVLTLPFLPKKEVTAEVETSAAAAFYQLRVGQTKGKTGVLIYLSLFERTVAVCGDSTIAKKLSFQDWEEVKDRIIDGIKGPGLATALTQGVQLSGRMLAEHFPPQVNDRNELENRIRFL